MVSFYRALHSPAAIATRENYSSALKLSCENFVGSVLVFAFVLRLDFSKCMHNY